MILSLSFNVKMIKKSYILIIIQFSFTIKFAYNLFRISGKFYFNLIKTPVRY